MLDITGQLLQPAATTTLGSVGGQQQPQPPCSQTTTTRRRLCRGRARTGDNNEARDHSVKLLLQQLPGA